MTATLRPIRGRASLAVQMRDRLRDEVHALKAEARQFGNAADSAYRLYVYVAFDGERSIEQAAAHLVWLTGRARRRHGPKDAA